MSIELPVDIGENVLKYSTTERLQETFVAVIEYLLTSEHSPQEWIEFLSLNDYESVILLAKATERMVELEMEDIEENEQQTINESNDEETEETANDYSNASALSLLCQILVMFGSLNASKFCPIITEHAYECILSSIKYHKKIDRFDTVNRLKLIEFIAINHKKIKIESVYIEILCEMLDSEYTDVIDTASSALIYSIGRSRKTEIKSLLELIENTLSSDTFRHFTQFYFKLLNSLNFNECTDDTLELLITFQTSVFKWNLDSFYYTSDIKVLIDIYIRSFHNTAPTNKSLLLCLDGVYNIIRWKQYSNTEKLNQYKSEEMIEELDELTQTVQTASNDFNEYENKENKDYSQEQLSDVLKLIEKIQKKINAIMETLIAIKNGEYDYDKALDEIIKLPIDISEYALNTKSMNVLQTELMELLQFLSESVNTPQEWIDFLSDEDYEIFNRLCLLSNRLLIKEKKILNVVDSDSDNKEFEENKNESLDNDEEDTFDNELLFPFSALCQLLATFSSLNPSEFTPILKENIFENIIRSLKHSKALNSDDLVVRLQSINFMICNVLINGSDMWFYKVLIGLLSNEYETVLLLDTKCIVFYISKLNDLDKQKQYLTYLQSELSDDDFRHFTEHYFEICNDAQWYGDNDSESDESDIQTKLLIDFMVCVVQNEMNNFFFSSDLKVLIEIFERTLHNSNINGTIIHWVITAIDALFNWKAYKTELECYKYDELCQEIQTCMDNATEQKLLVLFRKLDALLQISM